MGSTGAGASGVSRENDLWSVLGQESARSARRSAAMVHKLSSWFVGTFVVAALAVQAVQGQEPAAKDAKGSPSPGPGGAQDGAEPQAPALPPGVVARVNGRDIKLEDYTGYLLASLGKSKLDELIDRLLLEEEAKALGVAIEPEKVESMVEEQIDRTIKSLYQGSRESYVAGLAKRRSTLEDQKAKLRQDLYYDALRAEVILKTRQTTEADLKRQFEKTHGEGGVQHVVRHILISTRGQGGETPSRPPAEAKERAEKVVQEIQGGLDFVQAVKQYSDDAFTKRNDGRIAHYRKGAYGEAFHQAVTKLTKESPLSGAVESPRGFHVVQLVERTVTRLEDVRPELEKVLRGQPPSTKEKQDLVRRLREKAKIEGL